MNLVDIKDWLVHTLVVAGTAGRRYFQQRVIHHLSGSQTPKTLKVTRNAEIATLELPAKRAKFASPGTRVVVFGRPADTDNLIGHAVSRELTWGNYSVLAADRPLLESVLLTRNGVNIIFGDLSYVAGGQFRGKLTLTAY